MRFALVDGQRREAEPSLSGICVGCGNAMVAKCGEVKVWHWAHRVGRHCDHWWENETEWHRRWKRRFPDDWQEVRQKAADGEWHIADVKTAHDWVLEFQHSYIKPEERRSRDAFYGKLIWVVDGLRRKTDWPRFAEAYNRGRQLLAGYPARRVDARNGALFRDWAGSNAHVFFDFGRAEIWWLMPRSDQNWAFVVGMNRREFVQLHLPGGLNGLGFDQLAAEIDQKITVALTPRVVTRRGGRRGRRRL